MDQKPMTIVSEIIPERLQELSDFLLPIGNDIKNNQSINFAEYSMLHYCCLIIIEDENPPQGSLKAQPVLVFEANIDGEPQAFLSALFRYNPDFMHKVYSCCRNYTADVPALLASLLSRDRGANAFYVGKPGQTRELIEYQRKLRQDIEIYINANRPALVELPPAQIKAKLIEHLTSINPDFNNRKPAEPGFFVKNGAKIFNVIKLTAGLLSIVLIAATLGWVEGFWRLLALAAVGFVIYVLVYLRWLESHDIQDERLHWESSTIAELQEIEDRQPQNHLSSIIYVKPGQFRLKLLALVLFFINVVARLVATQGNLSGIVTIHFARWLILPGKPGERARLLFFSNYDGSWENYLGEFIDHASDGLTAVWSNTESGTNRGFPNTQWLALIGGARDEQRFKAFARNSQRREMVWYSAYPDLSVKNISNNQKIHEGLFEDVDLSVWLKRL